MKVTADFSAVDHAYMAQALRLAERGRYTTHTNPRVGCVIVKDGVEGSSVVGEGWHEYAGQPHAEVHALQQAGVQAKGATAYVTLEPCFHHGRTPPCSAALERAGVKRVVAAMVDPNPLVAGQGLAQLEAAGIETAAGLMEAQARALNPGFIAQMERQRPFVRVKMAMSLDGRTAMASGESVWITGDAARHDVQLLRAQAGAVLTGIDTVLYDKPSLNVRLSADDLGIAGELRQPKRVVLDSQLRFPLDCSLLNVPGDVLVYTCRDDAEKMAALQSKGVSVRVLAADTQGRLELEQVMVALMADGINEVHVEAGATLAGALVGQGLADELVVYVAPHLMGSSARGLFGFGLDAMAERKQLEIRDIRAVGLDWRITAGFL